jgi:TRAP-type uncharacterized transport system fused permease subunit
MLLLGVITLTGDGFRVSFMVTQAAAALAAWLSAILTILIESVVDIKSLTLFRTLLFVALVCIVMGTGIPTTTLYIVLAANAASALPWRYRSFCGIGANLPEWRQ